MADIDIEATKTYTSDEILTATDVNAEISNILTNHVSKSTAQTITGVKTFTGSYIVPVVVGTMRLWHDSTNGVLRVKEGSDPSSETDGYILQQG